MTHTGLQATTMRLALRFAGAGILAIAPASLTEAQSAGKYLAMDSRTSTWVEGIPDTGVVIAHNVISGSKMRMDMATPEGRAPKPFPTDGPVSIIVSDSGRTFAYLDTKKSQYAIFRPRDMQAQLERLGMKREFSGTEAKVDSLGAGPAIQGRSTSHYRVGMSTTMTHSSPRNQQSVKIASTTEHYFPTAPIDPPNPPNPPDSTDLMNAFNGFATITGSDMLSMYGSTFKDFTDKMSATLQRLPRAMPLRTSVTTTITTQGVSRTTKSTIDYTSVQWVNADPKVFEIPARYKLVEFSAMAVPPPKP